MNRTLPIAAAVTAALSAGTAFAAGPSVAAINLIPAANTIYISGSSAIKGALSSSIVNTFCGGPSNTTIISTTGDKNWLAFACNPGTTLASNAGNYLIDYRFEGGSVTGYLPIANNTSGVLQIDGPSLTATSIAVIGTTEANGQLDNFTTSAGGTLTRHQVDLGIGDVEPKAITGANYPIDYCQTVFGPINNGGMFGLSPSGLIVDEVYALFVNETGGTFTENPLNLSSQTVAAILSGGIKNWSAVTDVNGNSVSSALAIQVVNREYGSGSRTATDILMAGDNCSSNESNQSIIAQPAKTRYFSTGDVLAAAGSVPGAITYATIDNAPATNLSLVTLNGVAASNLNAANGSYPFWVEAAYVNNASNTGADSKAINNIILGLQNASTTAALADINAIPDVAAADGSGPLNTVVHANASLSGQVPTGGGTATVYINPWSRAAAGKGSTCHQPVYDANTFP